MLLQETSPAQPFAAQPAAAQPAAAQPSAAQPSAEKATEGFGKIAQQVAGAAEAAEKGVAGKPSKSDSAQTESSTSEGDSSTGQSSQEYPHLLRDFDEIDFTNITVIVVVTDLVI